jgi:hypothetical protein
VVISNSDYKLDGYLAKTVASIKNRLQHKWDCVGVVDGLEGSGKTTFAFQMCQSVDPTFNLDRVCFSEEQFNAQVIICKPGQAICLDEAMNVFFRRTTMSNTNILMVRVLAECRKRNLFLVFVLPSFFEMDRYPSLHRASFLVHVFAVPNKRNNLERGFFKFYARPAKKKLYLLGRKDMNYQVVRPSFFGRFAKTFVLDEQGYEKKKDQALLEKQTEKKVDKRDVKLKIGKLRAIELLCKAMGAKTLKEKVKLCRDNGIGVDEHDLLKK